MIDSAHVLLQPIHRVPLDSFAAGMYALCFLSVAFATYRRPVYGSAALLLLAPFALYRDIGQTTLTLPKFAMAAVAVALLLRRVPLGLLREKSALWMLAAAGAVAATTLLSYMQAQYIVPVLRETLKALEYALVFALAFLSYRCDPDESVIRRVLFAVAAAVSLMALAQEFTAAPAGMWVGTHAVPRIGGPLEGPNQLAGYLGLLLPVLAAFCVRRNVGAAGWIVLSLTICAEILTLSRAGVAAAVIGVAMIFVFDRRRESIRFMYAFAAPAIVALSVVVLIGGEISHFWSAGSQLQEGGLGTRGELWEAAYRLWRRHPLLGIGAGNYELELGAVGFPELHTHSNSAYLQALVEGGIPEFGAVLWVTWLSIVTFVRSAVRGPLVLGMLGASVGFAFHEIFDYLMFYPKVGLAFWVLLGVAMASIAATRSAPKPLGVEADAVH